jgi:hypothetical protein
MRKNTFSGLMTAVLALVLVAAPATVFAQDRIPDRPAQDQFGHMMQAINTTTMQIHNLNALDELDHDRVTVVDANDLVRGDNERALNQALMRHEADTQHLRDTINEHVPLSGALAGQQVVVDDIIGINVTDHGDVTVYHRPMDERE